MFNILQNKCLWVADLPDIVAILIHLKIPGVVKIASEVTAHVTAAIDPDGMGAHMGESSAPTAIAGILNNVQEAIVGVKVLKEKQAATAVRVEFIEKSSVTREEFNKTKNISENGLACAKQARAFAEQTAVNNGINNATALQFGTQLQGTLAKLQYTVDTAVQHNISRDERLNNIERLHSGFGNEGSSSGQNVASKVEIKSMKSKLEMSVNDAKYHRNENEKKISAVMAANDVAKSACDDVTAAVTANDVKMQAISVEHEAMKAATVDKDIEMKAVHDAMKVEQAVMKAAMTVKDVEAEADKDAARTENDAMKLEQATMKAAMTAKDVEAEASKDAARIENDAMKAAQDAMKLEQAAMKVENDAMKVAIETLVNAGVKRRRTELPVPPVEGGSDVKRVKVDRNIYSVGGKYKWSYMFFGMTYNSKESFASVELVKASLFEHKQNTMRPS